MECCTLSCVGVLVALCVVYKLLDTVLRWPRVTSLTDRYILVTGCDTGFGHDIARRLDSLGCHVFAGCLTDKGKTELHKACSDRLTTLSLDVANPDSVRRAFDYVKSKLPEGQGLWGLMNNAGILGHIGPEELLHIDDYKQVLAVNTFGLIDVTVTFLPLIKRARGRIVSTASVFGRFTLAGCAPYCLSKYGVETFIDGLRRSMRKFRVKAILIEPGMHKTPITSGDNVLKLFTDAWNAAPDEARQEYGQDYYDHVMRTVIAKNDKVTSVRVSDVIDAYEHALLGMFPRTRYVVGKDARFLWLPIQSLPEWLGDWILDALDKDKPEIAALKKTQ